MSYSEDDPYGGTPMSPMDPRPSPAISKYTLPSVTKVVKGQDGKTYVQSVVDVEDDVLSEEKEEYVISDDEIDKEMKNIASSNMHMTRSSISSNMSMRLNKSNSRRY